MKKTVCVLITVLLMAVLAACGQADVQDEPVSAEPSADPAVGGGPVVGGWEIYAGETAALPDSVKEAFDTATETLTGAEYIPVALAGEQVVGGMNYKIICRQIPSVAELQEDAGTYQVVEIYNDFEGGATITSVRDFDLTAYTDGAGWKPDNEPIDGGWGVPAEFSAAAIPENAQAAFDKATADLEKGKLTPAALLATQVVAGTNYMFVCYGSVGVDAPGTYVQIVVVYEDLDGNASITNACTLDPSVL